MVGIRGLITEKTSVALALGYQNAFYSNGARPAASWVHPGRRRVVVMPVLTTRIALGVRHDFQNSVIGNFYYDDGVYASSSQQTWPTAGRAALGAYDYRRYYGLPGTDEPRRDNFLQAGAVWTTS